MKSDKPSMGFAPMPVADLAQTDARVREGVRRLLARIDDDDARHESSGFAKIRSEAIN